MKKFSKPSSTITAAALAGLIVSAIFGTINEFTELTISAGYVSLMTTVVSSVVGYWKKENVLKLAPEELENQ